MKCEGCAYLVSDSHECWEPVCKVFGSDEIPEEYERKDGLGCILNYKQADKMIREDLESLNYIDTW